MSPNLVWKQGRILASAMAELSGRRVGLSGQDPSFVLDGVNPSPSRHEPLFRELSGPCCHPQRRQKDYGWQPSFPTPPPPTYKNLPGPHHGLGEGQGSSTSYGCLGLFPEGWGGRVSQVGEREGFLQALTSASPLPVTGPQRDDLLSEQPLPPPPPPANTHKH